MFYTADNDSPGDSSTDHCSHSFKPQYTATVYSPQFVAVRRM